MTGQVLGADWSAAPPRPHYVDGRLLAAADLVAGQDAASARDRWIGQAAGAGVVSGLEVTGSATTLTVAGGLGCNRSGDPVVLTAAVTVPLTSVMLGAPTDRAAFSCCTTPDPGGTTSTMPAGRYVLTARPVRRLDGASPLAPPPTGGGWAGCAPRWELDGVQLRAVELPVADTVGGRSITDLNARNMLAHWCFGSPQLERLGVDPFAGAPLGVGAEYGGLDSLDAGELTDDDLPLAVFGWDGQAVQLLDQWSVRRRITKRAPLTSPWATAVADRRTADGQARWLQFQSQIESILGSSLAGKTSARTSFGYLPPVGYLPVKVPNTRRLAADLRRMAANADDPQGERIDLVGAAAPDDEVGPAPEAGPDSAPGFNPQDFFGALAAFGGFIDWEVADVLLQQSWRAAAVRTDSDPAHDESHEELVPGTVGGKPAGNNDDGDGGASPMDTTPILYYYVTQNVRAYLSATRAAVTAKNRLRRGYRTPGLTAAATAGAVPGLYVVFVANRWWYSRAQLPIRAADVISGGQ